MSILERVVKRVSNAAWFRRVGPKVAPRMDLAVYRWTRGRIIPSARFRAMLLLTTTGHKSGLPRTVPLLYMPDGDRFVVVASNFAREHHPAWSQNLLANPHATVQLEGARTVEVRARLAEGEERAELWRRVVDYYDNYEVYDERTEREIRVFALEPRGDQPG